MFFFIIYQDWIKSAKFIGAILTLIFIFFSPIPAMAKDFCAEVSEIPREECQALVALFNSTGGDEWKENEGWLFTNTPCSWYGVTCKEKHITEINLESNQLQGNIPFELGDLIDLEYLYLNFNSLKGKIPVKLGDLTNLKGLYLGGNSLNGSIPRELGKLTNLEVLSLDANQLNGNIPTELGNLTNLKILSLAINQLTGNIPAELGNLQNLTYLYLAENKLSGNIPPELGNLKNLECFYLWDNQLSGSIPLELGNLPKIKDCRLGGNQLIGNVPIEADTCLLPAPKKMPETGGINFIKPIKFILVGIFLLGLGVYIFRVQRKM